MKQFRAAIIKLMSIINSPGDYPEGEALTDVNKMNSKLERVQREARPVADVSLCSDEEVGLPSRCSGAAARTVTALQSRGARPQLCVGVRASG